MRSHSPLKALAGMRTELGSRSPSSHQNQRQHGVDQVVGRRMQHRRRDHGQKRQHHGRQSTVAVGTRSK